MTSLVEELQRDALTQSVRVSDLLRKAKTIAVKLELPELEKWVENELNGYSPNDDLPEYRKVIGQLKGFNPFHGWQPVILADPRAVEAFTTRYIFQKAAELEDLTAKSEGGQLAMPLTDEAKILLMKMLRSNSDFTLFVSVSAIVGILDAVRNALLEWSLKLEKAGVMGEGMSFSRDERKKAHKVQAVYNIGTIDTFTGNMGSGSGNFTVKGNTINAESKAAIEGLIERIRSSEAQLGLERASVEKLRDALASLELEVKKGKPSGSRVAEFLSTIRNIAEGAVGSLAAQGILYELSKLIG